MTDPGIRDPFPATVEIKEDRQSGDVWLEIVSHDGVRWVLEGVRLVKAPMRTNWDAYSGDDGPIQATVEVVEDLPQEASSLATAPRGAIGPGPDTGL